MVKLSDIKSWNSQVEAKITSEWAAKGNDFDAKTKKKVYSIDTPPPYVNTPVHMGHAVTYCYMDFFARYRRMKGYEVLFPLGLDRNGLPIEMAAEKKFGVEPSKIGREKFIEYCEKVLKEASEESLSTFSELGISFNSYKKGKGLGQVYMTDSPEYRTLTQSTFIDLFRDGQVYEDSRINNWDTKLQTTIADSEIDYKELPSTFNFVKWKVKETGKEIVIATTRPELICTCGMIIYNPKDDRYKNLNGKTAISPIFGEEIPIREHPLADPDKGSGIVMMCSMGDVFDIQFFREMGLKPRIAIDKYGKMNELGGAFKGLKVKEAREKIIEELKKKKLLEKQENITHRTPVSERSGAEVEFIEMPEFYLKQLDYLDNLREVIGKIDFYPSESKQILDKWIDSVSIDWPISRRRYYATPIPLWRSNKLMAVPQKGKYYQPWKENVPGDCDIFENGERIGTMKDKKFKDLKWTGEERVFDTWFDSSISELYIINHPGDFAKKAFPVSLRAQGKEIVRTWLYYTILRGYLETKKPAFKEAWIHQHILDASGKKMSKSLGNVIDPKQILKEDGAEALRFWSAIEGDLAKQDLSCSRERIKAELKTINKLINVSKFVMQFKKPKKPKITKLDELFIDYMNNLTSFTDSNYEKYNFYHPALKLRHFLWEIFASHYIEIVKNRAYNEEKKFSVVESASAHYSLHHLLENFLLLASPIIPQVTSVIADELKLDLSQFPKADKSKFGLDQIERIMEFNSRVWKMKKEKEISLKESISGVEIPTHLEDFEKDLRACHRLE